MTTKTVTSNVTYLGFAKVSRDIVKFQCLMQKYWNCIFCLNVDQHCGQKSFKMNDFKNYVTWVSHECHMSVTWDSQCHKSVTWVSRESHTSFSKCHVGEGSKNGHESLTYSFNFNFTRFPFLSKLIFQTVPKFFEVRRLGFRQSNKLVLDVQNRTFLVLLFD